MIDPFRHANAANRHQFLHGTQRADGRTKRASEEQREHQRQREEDDHRDGYHVARVEQGPGPRSASRRSSRRSPAARSRTRPATRWSAATAPCANGGPAAKYDARRKCHHQRGHVGPFVPVRTGGAGGSRQRDLRGWLKSGVGIRSDPTGCTDRPRQPGRSEQQEHRPRCASCLLPFGPVGERLGGVSLEQLRLDRPAHAERPGWDRRRQSHIRCSSRSGRASPAGTANRSSRRSP